MPGGIQVKEIIVSFVDECWEAELDSPVVAPSYFEMELYTFATADVSRVTSSLNCPFVYEFVPIGDGPTPVTLNNGDWTVEVSPDSYDEHMGQHDYVIKACIQVEGTLANCKTSALASVLVVDPCTATFPITYPLSIEMTASLSRTNFIDLVSAFPTWPFVDTIDTDGGYFSPGAGKCGEIKYVVNDVNMEKSTFVEYNGGDEIVMRPEQDNPARLGAH